MERPYPVQTAIVDLSTDGPQIISSTPVLLVAVHVLVVLSAHACNLKDDQTIFWILAASAAVSTEKRFYNREVSKLIVDNNAAATGKIILYYIPLNA